MAKSTESIASNHTVMKKLLRRREGRRQKKKRKIRKMRPLAKAHSAQLTAFHRVHSHCEESGAHRPMSPRRIGRRAPTVGQRTTEPRTDRRRLPRALPHAAALRTHSSQEVVSTAAERT